LYTKNIILINNNFRLHSNKKSFFDELFNEECVHSSFEQYVNSLLEIDSRKTYL